MQVACGAAAAVATAYQAPVAGMFFAAEIVLGRLVLAEIPLLLFSAFAGSLTGRYLLGGGPLFAVHAHIGIDASHVLFALLLATFMGVLGPGYSLLTRSLRATAKWPLPLLWSGILVGLLSLACTEVWGNGDAALLSIMHASPAVPAVLMMLVLRLCATTFCVGAGAVGGVFTPTLFVGSAIGLLTMHFVHASNPVFFAIVGMGCLLAAVTHAPFMATMIAVELTGQWMLLPVILLCNVVAWSVARRISPYSLYALATPEPVGSLAGRDRTAPSEDISRRPFPASMRLGTGEPPTQIKVRVTMMEEGVDG
jgi:CIC family chloride channel protein